MRTKRSHTLVVAMASPIVPGVDLLERLRIEVGLGALSSRIGAVDLVATVVDLDAIDLPSGALELLPQRLLGLPFGLRHRATVIGIGRATCEKAEDGGGSKNKLHGCLLGWVGDDERV